MKRETSGAAAAAIFSMGSLGRLAHRLKRSRPYRDDLLGIGGLHGFDRVSGIDRTLECVGRRDFDDLRNLHHVEEGRDSWHDVLAGRGRGGQDRRVSAGQLDEKRGQRFGQVMREDRIVRQQDFFGTREAGGGPRRGIDPLAGDKDMDRFVQGLGRAHGLGGRLVQGAVQNLGKEQDRHQITPASSLSLATSSAAEATLAPALRTGGAAVFKILRRGAISTPSSAGVFSSITFFLAFMMLGSEA